MSVLDSSLNRDHKGLLFYGHQDKDPHCFGYSSDCGYGDPISDSRSDLHIRRAPKAALVHGCCAQNLQYGMRCRSCYLKSRSNENGRGNGVRALKTAIERATEKYN